MPPPAEVPHEKIYDALKDEEIFDKNGAALPQKDPIWTELCKKYRWKILPKTLHLHMYKNCTKRCRDRILSYKDIKIRKIKKRKSDDDEEYHIYHISNPLKKEPLKFTISLTEEEWVKIKPIMSKRKKKLKPIWTDILYEKMFDAKGILCSHDNKNLSVTGDLNEPDELDILFNGTCRECGTGVNGVLTKIKDDDSGKTLYGFQIDTFAVQNVRHTIKRNFGHEDRQKSMKILANKHATEFREDIQKERMRGRSREPANLHDSAIYEKARQEARDKEIGYKKSYTLLDPFLIKACGIRKVSHNPFYLIYWTEEQVEFWRRICHKNLPMSIDATGGLIRKQISKNNKCRRTILYYALVVGIDEKIVPIMQFFSSLHHVAIIEEALNTWIEKSGATIPGNISTDGSTAMQHSVCEAFNKVSFPVYNLQCFEFLMKKSLYLPPCMYKSDLAHLLRTMDRWACFKGEKKTKTKLLFYKRCIAFMSKAKSLSDFRKLAVALLAISISPKYVQGSNCHEHLLLLNDAIQTHQLPEDNNVPEFEFDPFKSRVIYDNKTFATSNCLTDYVEEIFKEAKIDSDSACIIAVKKKESTDKVMDVTEKPNVYACKDFGIFFKSLCQKFPSWTSVMAEAYNCDDILFNSARSETFFRIRKGQVPSPLNVIRYLLLDSKKIEAATTRDYPSLRGKSGVGKEKKPTKSIFALPEKNGDECT